jgi:hypothetical protein
MSCLVACKPNKTLYKVNSNPIRRSLYRALKKYTYLSVSATAMLMFGGAALGYKITVPNQKHAETPANEALSVTENVKFITDMKELVHTDKQILELKLADFKTELINAYFTGKGITFFVDTFDNYIKNITRGDCIDLLLNDPLPQFRFFANLHDFIMQYGVYQRLIDTDITPPIIRASFCDEESAVIILQKMKSCEEVYISDILYMLIVFKYLGIKDAYSRNNLRCYNNRMYLNHLKETDRKHFHSFTKEIIQIKEVNFILKKKRRQKYESIKNELQLDTWQKVIEYVIPPFRDAPALRNPGVSCFANSVLQLLYRAKLQEEHLNSPPENKAVYESLEQMAHSTEDFITPALGKAELKKMMGSYQQSDPSELLNKIFNDLPYFDKFKINIEKESITRRVENHKANLLHNEWGTLTVNKNEIDQTITDLKTKYNITPETYKETTTKIDPAFYVIILPGTEISLNTAVHEVRSSFHSQSNTFNVFDETTKYQLNQNSQYVLFYINRVINITFKDHRLFNIPEIISVTIHQYKLTGFVCHSGKTINGGHYVAFIKSVNTNEWLCYDDAKKTVANEEAINILNAKANYVELTENRINEMSEEWGTAFSKEEFDQQIAELKKKENPNELLQTPVILLYEKQPSQ